MKKAKLKCEVSEYLLDCQQLLKDFDIRACRKKSPGVGGEESILDKGKTPRSCAGWVPDTVNRPGHHV